MSCHQYIIQKYHKYYNQNNVNFIEKKVDVHEREYNKTTALVDHHPSDPAPVTNPYKVSSPRSFTALNESDDTRGRRRSVSSKVSLQHDGN